MKFKVAFALTLFLNVLVHPLLHADDTQPDGSVNNRPSVSQPETQGRPDCPFCHLASAAQIGAPIATLTATDTSSWLSLGLEKNVALRSYRATKSSRAPPAA